jgi:hypothetical protein
MSLFSPSSVAGYPGDYQSPAYDRAWFNSNNIVARYNTIISLIGSDYNDNKGNGNNRIQGIQTGNNGGTYFARIWTGFESITFIANNISNPISADTIVQELSELFYCEVIDASRLAYFRKSLIQDGEVNYIWSDAWTAYTNSNDPVASQDAAVFIKNRLDSLLTRMTNAAEFQLM